MSCHDSGHGCATAGVRDEDDIDALVMGAQEHHQSRGTATDGNGPTRSRTPLTGVRDALGGYQDGRYAYYGTPFTDIGTSRVAVDHVVPFVLMSRGWQMSGPGAGWPRAIQGKGAFCRFKDQLHKEHPGLLPAWYACLDARANRRAVQ